MMRGFIDTMLHVGATVVTLLNFAILFFWLQYAGPKSTMKGFYELNTTVAA